MVSCGLGVRSIPARAVVKAAARRKKRMLRKSMGPGESELVDLIPTLLLEVGGDLQIARRRAAAEVCIVIPVPGGCLVNGAAGSDPISSSLLAFEELDHR